MTDEASPSPSIVVGLDPPGSLPESAAIDALALATGWPVIVVHAAEVGTGPDQLRLIEERLADSARALRDRGVDADSRVMIGPPVDVLIASAEALQAELIVVVGHRHRIDSRPTLSSVTSALLKVADRPVLVLPAGSGSTSPGFVAAVDRLIDLIDRLDEQDGLDRVAELRGAAAARLAPVPSPEDRRRVDRRLVDAIRRFETDHPTITAAVNDVAHHLSGMGI